MASIVVITMADDKSSTDRVMAAGVDGFIGKAATHGQIKDALTAVARREFVYLGSASGLSALGSSFPFSGLSQRWLEVLRHVLMADARKKRIDVSDR